MRVAWLDPPAPAPPPPPPDAVLPPPPAGLPGEALGHHLGLGVVQLEGLGAGGLQVGDLLLRLQVQLLLGGQLVLGRDPQHVAVLAHAQALALHDDVQGLVPGHVFQAQGDVAGDGVAGHHVEVGEVGNHLQQGPHLDVLEVQAQLFAGKAGALGQLVRVDLERPHFQHKLVVGLVGAVLPVAPWLDHHAHPLTALEGGDALHRRAEVGHVQPAAQGLGQAAAQELDHQALALLADVDTHLGAGQRHDDAAGAVRTTAEVDVAQRQLVAVLWLSKSAPPRRCWRPSLARRCFPAPPPAPCPAVRPGSCWTGAGSAPGGCGHRPGRWPRCAGCPG